MERRKDGSDSQNWAHTSLPNVHPQRLLPAPVTHLPTPCSNSLWREPISSCSASKSTPLSALFLIPAELQAPSLAVPRARCSQCSARGLPFPTHPPGSCPAPSCPWIPAAPELLVMPLMPLAAHSHPLHYTQLLVPVLKTFSPQLVSPLCRVSDGPQRTEEQSRGPPSDIQGSHAFYTLPPPLPPLLPQDAPPCIRARTQLEWRSQFRAGSPRVLAPPTQRQASSEGEDSVWPWCSWGSTMPPPSALAHLSEHVQQSMQQGNDDMPEVFTFCLENRRPRGIYWAGARGWLTTS